MSNQVFSYQLDSPFEEDISFLTIVSESEAGKEQRYQKWLKPRRTFRIQLHARQTVETVSIWNFYQARKGSFDSFLFENPNDSPVTAEIIGSGDGAKSVFYFGGAVGIGTGDIWMISGSDAVTRSVKGTGDYLSFSAYTIDYTIGQLTTNQVLPSGDVLKANYNFQYRVRFKDDKLTRQQFASNLFNFGIDLLEVI